jgi:Zn-dependent protease with chaperone function
MHDKALETRILTLASRVGVEGARIFEVDKSHDTNAVNAYVTGLLGSKRVVLWDTLIDRLDPDQVEFVMAHELGHYVLGHVVRGVVVSSLLTLFGLYLTRLMAEWAARRWSSRIGFDRLADVASAPLLLVCGHLVALVLVPAGYAYSRHMEREADRFALELTRANHAGATGFVAIQRENLGNPRPGPLYRIWRSTHPSLAERITFCNTYHPWREGRPLRYGGRFR